MSRPKVIVTRRWPAEVEAELAERYDVVLNKDDHPMSAEEINQALKSADAVLPTVSDKLDAAVLGTEPVRARFLGNFGVGYNHIDLEAAKKLGLTVTNTPGVLTDCTADIGMLLMLMVARRASEGEREIRSQSWSGWRPTHLLGTQVTGKTLGIIGMGRIAQAMAHRAHHGFGMKIIFFNPSEPPEDVINDLAAERCKTPEDVIRQADFLSLHCPGGAKTHHLLNAERIAMMKPGAYLINTARGDVVDTDALIDALKKGTIAGAGLDVFEGEPNVDPRFLELDNAVLLPHLGSASTETRVAMGKRVLANLDAFFAGETPPDRVV